MTSSGYTIEIGGIFSKVKQEKRVKTKNLFGIGQFVNWDFPLQNSRGVSRFLRVHHKKGYAIYYCVARFVYLSRLLNFF
jgi:hypothetical protein